MRKIFKGFIIGLLVMDFVFVILCIWIDSELSAKLVLTSWISTLAFGFTYAAKYNKL